MNQPSSQGVLPSLERLHERHPGLTPAVNHAYAEAAGVCLSRHHQPPIEVEIRQQPDGTATRHGLSWQPPGEREQVAWANVDDATRDGAYAVALAAVEVSLGLVAVARAETLTGADYYLGPPADSEGTDNLERAFRLEVSGVDRGSQATVHQRLGQKVDQARRGDSILPAYACVVGFQPGYVALRKVEVHDEQP